MPALLEVEELSVYYRSGRRRLDAVRGVSFEVAPAETVALVGGSGSGKSTTAQAIVRLLPANGVIASGRVVLGGDELTKFGPRALRAIRGRRIGFVPQDPAVSLNPVHRIGRQVGEVLLLHGLADRRSAPLKAVDALEAAGLDRPAARARQYPHELSGGMRQRVLIAIALVARPSLVIADEATSALDVTVQRHILDQLARMTHELGTGVLMITHDLGVAADRADRILVMHEGRIVEAGPPAQVLGAPRHPYTLALIDAVPSLAASARSGPLPLPPVRPTSSGPAFATPTDRRGSFTGAAATSEASPQAAAEIPLLAAEHLVKDFAVPDAAGHRTSFRAVDDVSLTVARRETLGLVGESGSGKTTTARILLRLEDPTAGRVILDGTDITELRGEPLRQVRRKVQVVFQNPYTSLNPKMSIADIVAEPLRSYGIASRVDRRRWARDWLDRVGLASSAFDRRPAELSGGQRQRVAIARALVLQPELVILDEPVSALDVLVQAQILAQLADLQAELGVSYLLISHDLAVVRRVAHRVAVMYRGRVVEEGPVDQVLERPGHDYTKELVA
ncbi:MAG TPA: ABC transporter ATP-binding protein, partial [Acidimicrobiales bacterium]|nr:ABC transporter ATP-binding protein [Acidimicrobiales bacterium]